MAISIFYMCIFASLLILGAAAPSDSTILEKRRPPTNPFDPQVEGGGSLNGELVHASDSGFYIGRKTSTYCPDPPQSDKECHSFPNKTIIHENRMAVKVPGGQRIYVLQNGALGFTQAHTSGLPQGATQSGLNRETSRYVYNGQGWFACPVKGETDTYQIFARARGKHPASCIAITLGTLNKPNGAIGAWQYT